MRSSAAARQVDAIEIVDGARVEKKTSAASTRAAAVIVRAEVTAMPRERHGGQRAVDQASFFWSATASLDRRAPVSPRPTAAHSSGTRLSRTGLALSSRLKTRRSAKRVSQCGRVNVARRIDSWSVCSHRLVLYELRPIRGSTSTWSSATFSGTNACVASVYGQVGAQLLPSLSATSSYLVVEERGQLGVVQGRVPATDEQADALFGVAFGCGCEARRRGAELGAGRRRCESRTDSRLIAMENSARN